MPYLLNPCYSCTYALPLYSKYRHESRRILSFSFCRKSLSHKELRRGGGAVCRKSLHSKELRQLFNTL